MADAAPPRRPVRHAEDVIAALRLAVEAAADGDALRRLVVAMLEQAPPTNPRATVPVDILLEAVRAADTKLELVPR